MPSLAAYLPDPVEQVLDLPIEELAHRILGLFVKIGPDPRRQDYHNHSTKHNFVHELDQRYSRDIVLRLLEAYNLLQQEGYLVPSPNHPDQCLVVSGRAMREEEAKAREPHSTRKGEGPRPARTATQESQEAVVFYSWQSDLANNTNRSFIETALEKASKDLAQDPSVLASPRVDQDTRGVAGSPDIFHTILKKIDDAAACVFDVSIIARPEKGRPCPNPNVMLELGYALSAKSDSRIIMVFNEASGTTKELPFDLGFKRATTYEAHPDDADLHERRKELEQTLRTALATIFSQEGVADKDKDRLEYFYCVYMLLQHVVMTSEQYPERQLNPWVGEFRSDWQHTAVGLRSIAAEDYAVDEGHVNDLTGLADALDQVASREAMIMDGRRSRTAVEEAAGQARELLAGVMPVAQRRGVGGDLHKAKRTYARRLIELFDRFAQAVEDEDSGTVNRARRELAAAGHEGLTLTTHLELIEDADGQAVRDASMVADTAEIRRSNDTGFRDAEELRGRLEPVVEPLRALIG